MHDVVVVAAEQDTVTQAGRAAVGNGHDVVSVAPGCGSIAARERAAAIAQDQSSPEGTAEEPLRPADVENRTLGPRARPE